MTQNNVAEVAPVQKQPYTRPELVRHGEIETITHEIPTPGASQPV